MGWLRPNRKAAEKAVSRDAIFRTVLQSLHDTLDGPNQAAIRQPEPDVNLAPRIGIVGLPLATDAAADDFGDIRAQIKQPRSHLLREQPTRLRFTILTVIVKEKVDVPKALWCE